MYCSTCGKEINDDAVVCVGCGCLVQKASQSKKTPQTNTENKTQTALILGIVGIIFAWIFALVGHIASIIGIVIGIKEYKETNKMTGLVLSIVGEVCAIFSSIIGAVTLATAF